MEPLFQKLERLPRVVYITAALLVLSPLLILLFLPHVSAKERCDFIVDEEDNFIEYKDSPVGSSSFWTDFEHLPYHIEASVTLLRPQIGSSLYSYVGSSGNTTPPINAVGQSVPMQWGVGGAIGIGYEFYHYDWDFLAKYSYFTSSASGVTINPLIGNGTVIPAFGVGLLNHTVTNASSTVGFTWNNLDILLEKKFHFRENLLIFTSLGLETYWLSYNQSTTYTGGPLLGPQSAQVQQTSNLWGIGPEVGLKTHWLFVDCFYFKGFTSAALEYLSQNTYYGESGPQNYNPLYFSDQIEYIAPTLEIGLGFGFAKYFACSERFIRLEILYEQRTFFNQNQLLEVGPAATPRFTHVRDNLSLQGFIFKIDFRY